MTNEKKERPDINPTKVMVKVILIVLATSFIIMISLITFINIKTSKPLLVDFTEPYELNSSNHSAVSTFIEESNDEMKIIAVDMNYDLHRQETGIQVKEFTSEKEFVRQITCKELTSFDVDYSGRFIQLKGCGPSSGETISLGSIPY